MFAPMAEVPEALRTAPDTTPPLETLMYGALPQPLFPDSPTAVTPEMVPPLKTLMLALPKIVSLTTEPPLDTVW
jgi:hypothetical protein